MELLCIYGTGLQTAEQLTYTSKYQFPDSQPYITWGDGDATVNARSLRACRRFASMQREPVHFLKCFDRRLFDAQVREAPIAKADHLQMLHSTQLVSLVRDYLANLSAVTPPPPPPRKLGPPVPKPLLLRPLQAASKKEELL